MSYDMTMLQTLAPRIADARAPAWMGEIAAQALLVALAYRDVANEKDRAASKEAIAVLSAQVAELSRVCLEHADYLSKLEGILKTPAGPSSPVVQ